MWRARAEQRIIIELLEISTAIDTISAHARSGEHLHAPEREALRAIPGLDDLSATHLQGSRRQRHSESAIGH